MAISTWDILYIALSYVVANTLNDRLPAKRIAKAARLQSLSCPDLLNITRTVHLFPFFGASLFFCRWQSHIWALRADHRVDYGKYLRFIWIKCRVLFTSAAILFTWSLDWRKRAMLRCFVQKTVCIQNISQWVLLGCIIRCVLWLNLIIQRSSHGCNFGKSCKKSIP